MTPAIARPAPAPQNPGPQAHLPASRPLSPDSSGLVRVRRATAADREPLVAMFDRCSTDTRYRRFHAPVKAIPARYLTEALSGSPFHFALVAWHQDDEGEPPAEVLAPLSASGPAVTQGPAVTACPGQVPVPPRASSPAVTQGPAVTAAPGRAVALGSCRLVAEGAAELGLLVEDAWQRHGVGTRLLRELVAYADSIGVRVLEAQLLAEQSWITSLLRPFGPSRVLASRHGVLTVTIRR